MSFSIGTSAGLIKSIDKGEIVFNMLLTSELETGVNGGLFSFAEELSKLLLEHWIEKLFWFEFSLWPFVHELDIKAEGDETLEGEDKNKEQF